MKSYYLLVGMVALSACDISPTSPVDPLSASAAMDLNLARVQIRGNVVMVDGRSVDMSPEQREQVRRVHVLSLKYQAARHAGSLTPGANLRVILDLPARMNASPANFYDGGGDDGDGPRSKNQFCADQYYGYADSQEAFESANSDYWQLLLQPWVYIPHPEALTEIETRMTNSLEAMAAYSENIRRAGCGISNA